MSTSGSEVDGIHLLGTLEEGSGALPGGSSTNPKFLMSLPETGPAMLASKSV